MSRELRLRVVSGIVLAVVVLTATWLGGITFRLLAAAIALLVYSEWTTMAGIAARDFRGHAAGWVAMALVCALAVAGCTGYAVAALAGAVVLAVVYGVATRTSGWLAGGIAYSGLTAVALSAIRGDTQSGLAAMLFIFAVVWATDILAYFVGRAIGGPKLAPRISPGKTWSGAIGGAIAAVIAGALVHMAFVPLASLLVPALALVLSVFSQIGDLFESFIKRRFGVKDSGRLIPGHGGVMDRVDGLVFACFAAFLIMMVAAVVSGQPIGMAGVLPAGL